MARCQPSLLLRPPHCIAHASRPFCPHRHAFAHARHPPPEKRSRRIFGGLFWIPRCALLIGSMPFTLSHPAAAIPFRRTPLIMSAVVMGCLIPDFPHFVFLPGRISFTHTFTGMFVLDLPVALAALWLFHAFLKQPVFMFLPSGFRRRLTSSLSDFPFWPRKRLALIAVSILTGTATHLLWDAFTHRDSWICENWALLQGWIDLPAIGKIQMYNLLEYASSFFGAAVILVWICWWYRTTKPSAAPPIQPVERAFNRGLLPGLPILALLGGALWSWHVHGFYPQLRPIVHYTSGMLVSATTFFLIELFVCGVILRRFESVPSCTPV